MIFLKNINQEGLSTELVTIVNHEHNDINPDYGAIATGAAVTGFIVGLMVVGNEYISGVKEEYNNLPNKKPVGQGGSTLLDYNSVNGGFNNSLLGINVVKDEFGVWIVESTGKPATWFQTYITGSQNPVFQALNLFPGHPSFVGWHDAGLEGFGGLMTAITIPTYYAISQCAAMPSICANMPGTFINVGTGGIISPTSINNAVNPSKPKGRQSISLLDNLMK